MRKPISAGGVRVPFGRGEKIGVIVEVPPQRATCRRKAQAGARHPARCAAASRRTGWRWPDFCSRYYQHPLGEVVSPGVAAGAAPCRDALPRLIPQRPGHFRITEAGHATLAELAQRSIAARLLLQRWN
jgi:primosomal protein N'